MERTMQREKKYKEQGELQYRTTTWINTEQQEQTEQNERNKMERRHQVDGLNLRKEFTRLCSFLKEGGVMLKYEIQSLHSWHV